MNKPQYSGLLLLPLVLCDPLLAGGSNSPRSGTGWTLGFSPSWKNLGEVSYSTGSRSSNFTIPQLLSGDSLTVPSIGETDEYGDRTYDDGYVNESAITGASGLTWYWGYEQSTQVSGSDLALHATGYQTTYNPSISNAANYSADDDLDGFTPQLDFNYYPENRTLGISSILISFSMTGVDSGFHFSNFAGIQTQDNYQLNYTDTYDLGVVADSVPTAPYYGTEDGPGASIPNLPADRTTDPVLLSTDTAEYSNSISSDLDMTAFSIALGPTFEGSFADRMRWQFAAGTTLNLYDYQVKQRERLSASVNGGPSQQLQTWQDSTSGIHLGVGLFVRGTGIYELNEEWFTSAFIQLEAGNSFELNAGLSSFEIDPNSVSFGMGIGRKF